MSVADVIATANVERVIVKAVSVALAAEAIVVASVAEVREAVSEVPAVAVVDFSQTNSPGSKARAICYISKSISSTLAPGGVMGKTSSSSLTAHCRR